MGILNELTSIFSSLSIPCETGRMSSPAPDTFCVLIPVGESSLWGDDGIDVNVEECVISLFTKENYIALKNRIISALLACGFTVNDRRYIEYEEDTGYFHYEITVESPYPFTANYESEEKE